MSKKVIAEILVNEWKLANGWTPARILQEHFAGEQRFAKVASERIAAAEARVLVAGVTLDFVRDMAKALGTSIGAVVELLKDSAIVKFFKAIGWSFQKLWQLLKEGLALWRKVRDILAGYVASTKVVRWTTEELKKLDEFLKNHPYIRRLSGWVIAGLLCYIWFQEAYVGDPDYDFDVTDIVAAIGGAYAFSDIFGGTNGAKMLVGLLAGMAISFPWPGSSSVHFIGSVIGVLLKRMHKRYKVKRETKEEEKMWEEGSLTL